MNRREFAVGFSFASGTLAIGALPRNAASAATASTWEVNVVAAESFFHAA
ncbi:MAG: hypothetical protein GIW95_04510, partial [Candidatus Eremiobacteraeota bacterium]|nr:hypothetical protein [Candidatus Eremiobacteraeota bacterium]